ncbi:RNA pseudouridine synthase [Patescibacteria group bacterium]|nr:RNA pseudouridine synthase [Patescibacteria group bacterium]
MPLGAKIDICRKINIIYEEKGFLVLEKPAGLTVHPHVHQKEATLVDWLLEKYPEIRGVGESFRPGLVHRLDRDVSGLMVVAKNISYYHYLVEQFQARQVQKKYLALVLGNVPFSSGTINFSIGRNRKGKLVAFSSEEKNSVISGYKNIKTAITKYRIVQKINNFTLLELQILTGRTNQIRLHLKTWGFPIVGDKKYFQKSFLDAELQEEIKRIFLHAFYLSFLDQERRSLNFESDWPLELKNFLSLIKN